jgi:tetratricopeptide (TPR) repeat protein
MKAFVYITLVPMALLFAQVDAELRPRQPVEQELLGGGKYSYRISLKAGEYLQVGVEQKGIDVNLHLFDPSGAELFVQDQYDGTHGTEPLFVLAEKSGEYRLEVRSDYRQAAAGRYRAAIVALHEPTALDRVRVAAAKALAEAAELRKKGTPDLLRRAGEKYKVALDLWEEAGDTERQAVALLLLGATYNSLYDRKTALEYCERALVLRRQLGDDSGEAEVLDFIGSVHYALSDPKKALSYHQRALALGEKILDPARQASALNSMGAAYNQLGEKQKAIDFYRRALPLYRVAGNSQQEAVGWSGLGLAYEGLGAVQKSIQALLKSLDLRREAKDRRGEARSLSNIAFTYSGIGDYERALEYDRQALRIRRELEDVRDQAISLNNMGAVYFQLGEMGKAMEYREAALLLARAARDRQLEASTLSNIGTVHFEQRHTEAALEYFQKAAEVWKTVGERSGEAATLKNIAGVHLRMGNLREARDYANQALSLSRAVSSRQLQIATLRQMADIDRQEGKLGDARARMEEALGVIETLRKSASSPGLRSSFFASVQPVFEEYVDLLMQSHKAEPSRGYDRTALEVVERSRARSLMELLGNASREVRRGVESSLLERESKLQQRTGRLAARGEKSALDALWIELGEVEERIAAESAESAAAVTEPLRVAEIQEKLLDADTLLLEYALGRDRSFLWAVTPAKLISFELPKRAEIEEEAGRLIEIVARHKGESEYREVAASLSRKLLEPVRGQLAGKRLVLVVTGKLQYLPFGALPAPGEEVPLVVKNDAGSASEGPGGAPAGAAGGRDTGGSGVRGDRRKTAR